MAIEPADASCRICFFKTGAVDLITLNSWMFFLLSQQHLSVVSLLSVLESEPKSSWGVRLATQKMRPKWMSMLIDVGILEGASACFNFCISDPCGCFVFRAVNHPLPLGSAVHLSMIGCR